MYMYIGRRLAPFFNIFLKSYMREARPPFQYLYKKVIYEGGSPPCMCMKQIEQERAGCGGNKRRGMGGRGARGRGGEPHAHSTPTCVHFGASLQSVFIQTIRLYDEYILRLYDYTTTTITTNTTTTTTTTTTTATTERSEKGRFASGIF